MLHLGLQSLRHRRGRATTAVVGIAVVVSLAFVLTGVTASFSREVDATLDALGSVYLIPEDASGLLTGLVADDRAPEGTQPMLFARDVAPRGQLDLNVFGLDRPSIEVTSGRNLEGDGQMVIDRRAGVAVGERVQLGGTSFEVVGLTDGVRLYAGAPVAFVTLADAQQVYFGDEPVARAFVGDEATGGRGLEPMDRSEARTDLIRPVRGAIAALALTRTLLWVMVAGIVFSIGRLAVLDRRRELAALRSLGADLGAVASTLVIEGLIVSLAGAALGLVLGLALAPVFPMPVESSPAAAGFIVALAALVGVLAAAAGAWHLRRVTPAEAFRSQE